MTSTDQPTRAQLSTWTFLLCRDIGAGAQVMADGAVFGDGPTVLHWRDYMTGRATMTGPSTVTTLRHVMETMCTDTVHLMWESGGPATEDDGTRTDSLCVLCLGPMVEYTVDHDVIHTEGHCSDCGTREVWTLHR